MVAVAERNGYSPLRLRTFAVLLGVFPVPCLSGSQITRFVFENKCKKAVTLHDWNLKIEAGQVRDVDYSRQANHRITWSYVDATQEQVGNYADFIELNSAWSGPGDILTGHPSYSTYMGFNMASKYEALKPDGSGELACADGAAAVTYQPEQCPTGASKGKYLCDGAVDTHQEPHGPRCGSPMANFILEHSFAINSDGEWTKKYKGERGHTYWAGNYVNFHCSEDNGLSDDSEFQGHIGTMIDCTHNHIPFVLKVTTCTVDPRLATNGTTASPVV